MIAQGASGLLSVASTFMQAGIAKQNIDAKISALRAERAERERRHEINLRVLRKQAGRMVAEQQGAFIAGGVKLEGSAIDVVNDTLNDLLNAELNKEQELGFFKEQSAIEEAGLITNRKQIDTIAFLNATSSLLGSAGNIGLSGIGGTPSSAPLSGGGGGMAGARPMLMQP